MVPEVVSCPGQNAPFPVAAARLFSAGTASTHLESCNGLPTAERLYRSLRYSLTGPRDGSPAWCIIAAVAGPAAVIRMLAPRRGVVPTRSRRFWLGAAFCDFSEAVTGSGASPVAAVVVGAAAVVVAVLFTGFENAQSQRRPEKPRVASVHLRPRPVALPHLR